MDSRLVVATIVLGCTFIPLTSSAITSPINGAVEKPSGFQISVPFEDGERVEVISGYGPSAGSSFHSGTDESSKANDHYALDLVLPDHPNSGHGQPILAIADAEVVRAGWGTQGWSPYGLRVILRHTYNGTTFHSLYAHMDSITVSEGDVIEQGAQIGTLGGSCEGASSCNNFSTPHLHFALHRESNIGGSGSGGSYGGNAVVPELMDGQGDIQRGDILNSQNDGSGQVTDPCLVGAGETKIIDDRSPCFERVTDFWWDGSGGYDDHWYYTKAIDEPQSDTVGTWHFSFAESGDYDVEVYIPSGAETQQARYYIGVAGTEMPALQVDQSSLNGWHTLDTVTFSSGPEHHLRLPDNTGEPLSQEVKIAFDAIRLSPSTSTGGDTGTADTGTSDAGQTDTGVDDAGTGQPDGGAADTGMVDAGASDTGGDIGGSSDAAVDGAGGSDTGSDSPDAGSGGGSNQTTATGSCSTSTPSPAAPVWLLLAMGVWAIRRRVGV